MVHAAGEHDVAAAGAEFAHRVVDGDQRGGAGRVDGVRGAGEVEPVRGPGGDEVGHHQVDAGLLAQRAEPLGERGADRVELIVRQIRQQLAQRGASAGSRCGRGRRRRPCRREVAAAAEHDADLAAVAEPVLPARVLDRRRGGGQRDELVGLDVARRPSA